MVTQPQSAGTRVKALRAAWPWISSTTSLRLKELLLQTSTVQSWVLRWVCPPRHCGSLLYTLLSLCPTGLAQPSSCRTQSYTLHSFSHVCALIFPGYSREICSTWLQSQFLWSLVMTASGTHESVARTSANADMCSKLSDSGMTSVRWAY